MEWIEKRLGDIGDVVGGATPSTKHEEYYGGKIAWITPKDLSSFKGRYILSGERNITEAGLDSCSAQMLPPNTVLFTSRAPIGYIAIAKQSVCTNQGFKSIVPHELSLIHIYVRSKKVNPFPVFVLVVTFGRRLTQLSIAV